jgi:hypothetical protein
MAEAALADLHIPEYLRAWQAANLRRYGDCGFGGLLSQIRSTVPIQVGHMITPSMEQMTHFGGVSLGRIVSLMEIGAP